MKFNLKKAAKKNVTVKCNKDLGALEFCSELEGLKDGSQNLLCHVKSATSLYLCQLIQQDYGLGGCFPNIEPA
jgi:hypothetical protein